MNIYRVEARDLVLLLLAKGLITEAELEAAREEISLALRKGALDGQVADVVRRIRGRVAGGP